MTFTTTTVRGPRAMLAAPILLAVALAGCARGGGGDQAPSVRAQAEPVYRELAQCIRNNGYPGFPDPVVKDDGTVELPPDVQRILQERSAALERACEHIVERLPASVKDQDGDEGQATPAQIEERKRFAKCVREHGVPDFPDPDSAGRIMVSNQDGRRTITRAQMSAFESCGLRGQQGVELKESLNDLGLR
jgi:hypothetical protein